MSRKKKNETWGQNGFEEWGGYMAAKKAKLEEQFRQGAAKDHQAESSLFQGISIFVNGYTNPTADELRHLMMVHGGVYHHYMRPQMTTHVIASNLPYSKIIMYQKSKNPVPICKPEWIMDSIEAGRLLNFQNYLLYSNYTKTQPQLKFKTKDIIDSSIAQKTLDPGYTANENLNVSELSLELKEHPSVEINQHISSNDVSKTNFQNTDEKRVTPVKISESKSSTMSTKNPEFLSEFYNNSRLHHISTMGATFKDYVNELRDKSNGKFSGFERLKQSKKSDPSIRYESDSEDEMSNIQTSDLSGTIQESVIMHIDMDCFFVSVGLRNKPDLKGVPVAVTHAKGNKSTHNTKYRSMDILDDKDEEVHGSMSEVASCSYEARKAGVKNGMFLGQALKLCPNLKMIKYDFQGYTEVSYTLYDTVASYTLEIEAVSCDEMYADCTRILKESGLTPLEFANVIRNEIKEKTGCPVSTGFGKNKLQARLATRKAKPDGQFYLTSENVQNFIESLNVRDLPGVGATTMHKLNAMNVRTCAELQSIALGMLQKEFGKKNGEMLYNICRGIDNSKLNLEHIRKSVSAEVNYGIRFKDSGDAEDFLKKLSEEVCTRLKKASAKGRCVTLKLMVRAEEAPKETEKFMGHGLCYYFTRSKNLIAPVDDLLIITKEVLTLWNQLLQPPEDIRGIGIQISRLELLKNNSGDANLMNFINRARHLDTENKLMKSSSSHSENQVTIRDGEKTLKQSKQKDLKAFCIPKQFLSTNEETYAVSTTKIKSFEMVTSNPTTSCKISNGMSDLKENIAFNCGVDNIILHELPEDIRNDTFAIKSRISPTSDSPNAASANVFDRQSSKNGEKFTDQFMSTSDHNSLSLVSKINCLEKNNRSNFEDMQDIDESVLAELPEDIRKEFIAVKAVKHESHVKNNQNVSKNIQTKQESYFKHTKSNSGRSTKVNMPSIQEIDMSVLIELPDDIRNEILNEYRVAKHEQTETSRSNNSAIVNPEQNKNAVFTDNTNADHIQRTESNLSFSQVDPEFLAALPEDVKNDVKEYCTIRKMKKKQRIKEASSESATLSNGFANIWNKLESNKTSEQSRKKGSTVKKLKKKKYIKRNNAKHPKSFRANEYNNENENKRKPSKDVSNNQSEFKNPADNMITTHTDTTAVEMETVILYNACNTVNDSSADQFQEMLNRLINQFLNLPVEQVKIQLQTWISKSHTINEVDFLSFATFLSMLPRKKRIEDLHILLKTMHRCVVKTESCTWHRAYRKTVEHVQNHMLIEYNSNLMLPSITCDLPNCNASDITM